MIEFLQSNWYWILFLALFVGMHAFGGGCCGGGNTRRRKDDTGREAEGQQGKSCH